MNFLSKRALAINPSPTLAITAKAKAMKAEGIDVISFGAGEPDFDTPDNIKKASVQAINNGFTKYTPTSGTPELKEAICKKLKRDNNLEYSAKNILVSNGAKQSLFNIIQTVIDPGDEVILPVPYWVSYEEMIKIAGGKCRFVTTKNFLLEPADLQNAITAKTKAIILNSPSNPSGAVYDLARLNKIADICVKNNILVISDEIYEKLIYEGTHHSIASINSKIKDLTITINGVSKSYSMTGWRIGYCAGPEEIIKAASSLQDHSTSNPNSIAQMAALEALNGSQKSLRDMVKAFKNRRNLIVDLFNQISDISVKAPAGAFYLFVDISKVIKDKYKGSDDFCQALLQQAKVACIPGSAFGANKYIRLSFATSEDNIKRGLKRIKDFLL